MNMAKVIVLLTASNVFMSFAWYAHLRNLSAKPWLIAVVISWGVAFFEYCFQVPANRLGHASGLRLEQLKILQEVISLAVFVPFSILYMREKPSADYLYAGLCILAALFFIFRKRLFGG